MAESNIGHLVLVVDAAHIALGRRADVDQIACHRLFWSNGEPDVQTVDRSGVEALEIEDVECARGGRAEPSGEDEDVLRSDLEVAVFDLLAGGAVELRIQGVVIEPCRLERLVLEADVGAVEEKLEGRPAEAEEVFTVAFELSPAGPGHLDLAGRGQDQVRAGAGDGVDVL